MNKPIAKNLKFLLLLIFSVAFFNCAVKNKESHGKDHLKLAEEILDDSVWGATKFSCASQTVCYIQFTACYNRTTENMRSNLKEHQYFL